MITLRSIWLGGGVILTLLFSLPHSGAAQVYFYEDAQGVLHYSDEPPSVPTYEILRMQAHENFRVAIRNLPQKDVASLISQLSQTHGMDPALVEAVVKAESAYNPQAVSKKGARGLMQLMPATAQTLGVNNIDDPEENLDAGIRYLRRLLERYDGDVELATAAYNAGEGAVKKYGGVPPYNETVDYVKKVRKFYDQLKDKNTLSSGVHVTSTRTYLAP